MSTSHLSTALHLAATPHLSTALRLSAEAQSYPPVLGPTVGLTLVFSVSGAVLVGTVPADVYHPVVIGVIVMAGARLGARLALRRGSRFIRVVLLVVVFALLTKLTWDQVTT